jgi:hypothetical protein
VSRGTRDRQGEKHRSYLELLPVPRLGGVTRLRPRVPLGQQRLELGSHHCDTGETGKTTPGEHTEIRCPDAQKNRNCVEYMVTCKIGVLTSAPGFSFEWFFLSLLVLQIPSRVMASQSLVEAALKDHGGRKTGMPLCVRVSER